MIKKEVQNNKELIISSEAVKYMGFDCVETFERFVKQSAVNPVSNPQIKGKFYSVEALNDFIRERELFHEEHYSYNDLIEKGWNSNHISKLNKHQIPYYARTDKFKGKQAGYKKEEVEELLNKKKVMKKKQIKKTNPELMNRSEVQQYLGITITLFQRCVSEGFLSKYAEHPPYVFYHKDDVDHLLVLREEYYSQHFIHKELSDYLTPLGIKQLEPVEIPPYARGDKFFQVMYAFKKDEVLLMAKKYGNKRNQEVIEKEKAKQHYTFNQITLMFNLTKKNCTTILNENNIKRYSVGRSFYFDKVQIESLKAQQEKLLKEYQNCISYYEAKEKGYPRSVIDSVKKYKVGTLLKCKYPSCETVYNELEILELIEKQRVEEVFLMPKVVKDPYELFVDKLEIYEKMNEGNLNIEEFKVQSPITSKEWFSFVKVDLLRRNQSLKRINALIRQQIYITHQLINFLKHLQQKEIFLIKTETIINFLVPLPIKNRELIINFLFEKQKVFMLELKNSNHKIYNIEVIRKYIKSISNNNSNDLLSADIYTVKEFKSCLEYCTDLEYHCKKSISEIVNKRTARHVSTWLYILIHLNNGWRHSDVTTFKDVEIDNILSQFNLFDIKWFIDNELSLAQARLIVSCIINRKFIISKTRVEGYFFCSDDLVIQVATAIVILTLFKKQCEGIVGNLGDVLMQFNNKYNEPTKGCFNSFFADMELDDFVFLSKKMNSSLMTYIYSITENETANKAIQSAAMLRGHKDIRSTLHYLKIDQNSIDFMSRQLFERGEFGYAYDKLVDRLYYEENKILSIEDKTEKIINIKKGLCNAFDVEFFAGFMNRYKLDREEVDNHINSLSIQEQQDLLENIFISSLPSKELNVQCLISGKCNKVGKVFVCHQCCYSIPNLYAINQICTRAQNNISSYNAKSEMGEKVKLSILINQDLEVLSEAIQRYGADIVYSYMNISRDEYRSGVEIIPEPMDHFIK